MANKRYDQFPSGTADAAKILLQADATTGALEKVLLSAFLRWVSATGGINNATGNVGINQSTPVQKLHVSGTTDNLAVGPLLVSQDNTNNIGVALTLDNTPNSGGRKFSFLSTGPGASGGAGDFAVYGGSVPAYVFRANSLGQYIAGQNFFSYLAQISVACQATTIKGIVIRLKPSQTANSLEVQDSAGSVLLTIDNLARLGIGITPAALVHIKAGTASAGTAPIKLTAGTNLTTPENGAIEFDGSQLSITIAGTRYPLYTDLNVPFILGNGDATADFLAGMGNFKLQILNCSLFETSGQDGALSYDNISIPESNSITSNDSSNGHTTVLSTSVVAGSVRAQLLCSDGITGGFTGVRAHSIATKIYINGQSYANNAAAIAGGLTAGDLYRNGDILQIVH